MTIKEKLTVHRQIEAENRRKLEESKTCTVANAIRKFNGDTIICMETKEYGQFWIGKAKFAGSHIRYESMRKMAQIIGHRIIIC